MELPFQIDQSTCNELAKRAGLNALGAYVNGVDFLNAGYVHTAFENLCTIRAACFRHGADEPEGVRDFEAALREADSTRWTGDKSHWLIADVEFALERSQICREVYETIDELARQIKPSGVKMTNRDVLSVIDQILEDTRSYIAPALQKEQEINRTMKAQRKINGCDYSQIPDAKDRPGSVPISFYILPENKGKAS